MNPPQPYTKCLIAHCGRTSGKNIVCHQFICGKHWRLIPKRQRAFRAMLVRKLKRGRNDRTELQEWRAWKRCVRIAIKNSNWFGI
jgi:hypothetical protein